MPSRLTELYAFVVTDGRGDEGVLRRMTDIGTQPCIAQDMEHLEQFRRSAEAAAAEMRLTLTVARFVRADLPREVSHG
jgi:hypothetical protein